MDKLLFLSLFILASCGSEPRTKCYEEYEYQWNGYTYVEHKVLKCEEIDD